MIRHPLHDGWQLRTVPGTRAGRSSGAGRVRLPASVPGCVHTDLLAAGLIEDPYLDAQRDRSWPGSGAPTGCTRLDLHRRRPAATAHRPGLRRPRHGRHGRAQRHRARAGPRTCTGPTASTSGPVLRTGANTLRITLHQPPTRTPRRSGDGSATGPTRTRSRSTSSASRPATSAGTGDRRWSRPASGSRSACSVVGGPARRGAPAGHGRRRRRPGRAAGRGSSGPPTSRSRSRAAVGRRETRPRRSTGIEALLILTVDEPGTVVAPRLRRPAAARPRRDADRRVGRGAGHLVAPDRLPVGAASTPPATAPSPWSSTTCRSSSAGSTGSPTTCSPTGSPAHRLADRFRQAADANVNYLRVWGGGRYESEDFYDLADEMGLLVQQDFLFACAAYPEEEPFAAEVEAEARENVVRLGLAPQPGAVDRQQREHLGPRGLGLEARPGRPHLGRRLLLRPAAADRGRARPDPAVLAGQPVLGLEPDRHPNDPAHGTTHIWDVWNTDDYTKYGAYRPALRRRVRLPGAPGVRDAAPGALRRPARARLARHGPPPEGRRRRREARSAAWPTTCRRPRDFDDWHYLTQLNQARAVALGIEHFRSLRPALHGHDHVAAQRLLAGHLVGGGRRRRAQEAALVRACGPRTPTGC